MTQMENTEAEMVQYSHETIYGDIQDLQILPEVDLAVRRSLYRKVKYSKKGHQYNMLQDEYSCLPSLWNTVRMRFTRATVWKSITKYESPNIKLRFVMK